MIKNNVISKDTEEIEFYLSLHAKFINYVYIFIPHLPNLHCLTNAFGSHHTDSTHNYHRLVYWRSALLGLSSGQDMVTPCMLYTAYSG